MLRASLAGLDRKRLRLGLGLFFLALAVPTGILIRHAYSQLKWEAFHRHQAVAEELAARIDTRLERLFAEEEARAFTDYAFLVVAGDPSASFLQRSPLSVYPVASGIPGLIGYFQVDARGAFSTPLLPLAGTEPAALGINDRELQQRLALADRIRTILGENRLVGSFRSDTPAEQPPPEAGERKSRLERETVGSGAGEGMTGPPSGEVAVAPAAKAFEERVTGQAAFDRLNEAAATEEPAKREQAANTLGRVEDLQLEPRYTPARGRESRGASGRQETTTSGKRAMRKEYSALPEPAAALPDAAHEADAPARAATAPRVRISTFESEIDPFEVSLLDSGHFVLFRKVWRDGQRYIQGALIERQPFLQGVLRTAFSETSLSQMSDLVVAWRGSVLSVFGAQDERDYLSGAGELTGALLYRTHLSAPLNDMELIFGIKRLPAGPGATLINWLAVVLALVLCGGLVLMYRLAAGQISLARQQQDFVAAVSHELKTPLTSIRMYGEMLREGWAPEEKKRTYYDYICNESERLSRLITNVLQLARMTRNDLKVDLKPVRVAELLEDIRSGVAAQIERAGFEFTLGCDEAAAAGLIRVDRDYFTQIIINLVDNALKFSARAERPAIDIQCRLEQGHTIQFSVRDYGPGVPGNQMKKIFRLFYRSESELTRETVGTGIGLALVHQLALAMDGAVDVVNRTPGAEFRVCFPLARG
jgi:two-component system phosphate regulon sensor histidine kinase PhoR